MHQAALSLLAKAVRQVEGLFPLADQIEARLAVVQRQVVALTSSLVTRAFRGTLVTQDPKDEPEEKLLDSIRIQRAKLNANDSVTSQECNAPGHH
jgi:type I restriction enzyme S subunit